MAHREAVLFLAVVVAAFAAACALCRQLGDVLEFFKSNPLLVFAASSLLSTTMGYCTDGLVRTGSVILSMFVKILLIPETDPKFGAIRAYVQRRAFLFSESALVKTNSSLGTQVDRFLGYDTLRLIVLDGTPMLYRISTQALNPKDRYAEDAAHLELYVPLWGVPAMLANLTAAECEPPAELELHEFNGFTWDPLPSKVLKTPGNYVYADGLVDFLVADIKRFLASKARYARLGIPYHRGYLLHGPPGTGKTTLAQVVASQVGFGVSHLVADEAMDDHRLALAFRSASQSHIVLLEDVDSLFPLRNALVAAKPAARRRRRRAVTLSGVLNALDGVSAAEERIYFLTTNFFAKLDPAIVRPGRCDVSVLVDYATPGQAGVLFCKFYDTAPDEFVEALADRQVTPADLQGHFLKHDTAQAAVRNVADMQMAAGSCCNAADKDAGNSSGGEGTEEDTEGNDD